jgi:hypothetical protein
MATKDTEKDDTAVAPEQAKPESPKEIGGRDGPDPTRYGDWEKAGRCIDF